MYQDHHDIVDIDALAGILVCIVVSSLALAVEEPDQVDAVLDVLLYMDYVFTSIFTFEMIVRRIPGPLASNVEAVHRSCAAASDNILL